ncbi:RagB/SusD family nutrient uptake outer membrane protein [Nibribacter ruber]|uniref:RagB/SusD family nutrient uptake outer membrane protein n=1 Tax=Nibribacter ruber TaxID=2698458 RepID=A0A6P1NXW0_9BACT|nr:RagB/SusD family nutrient uptake outer membrane protein [Nibribacter ruber]QHL86735.1 RagB/SusD family nutrient uptake outer membrane protein [Nibribacter ruber]
MKLKKFNSYILWAAVTTGLSITLPSCNDYLEVEPVSSFSPDYVFSNVNNVQKQLTGVYAALGGDQGYGIRLSMYYPLDNDEMMGQSGNPGDNERRDIARYTVQPSNTQLAGPFGQLYAGVERANICIYYIPKMEMYTNGTETEKRELRRMHGEALTLRAQFYFELIRNWGDIPAQFNPSSFETDLFKGKTDRDEIYDKLIADLAEAATLVPWRGEVANDERITQGAVRALRARLALFRGGFSLRRSGGMQRGSDYLKYYQIARDECDIIIKRGAHKLNPSYQAVWKDAIDAHRIEPNGEVMWEIAMAGGSSATGDSKLGYYNGPRLNGSTGNGALTILPTYFYSFDSKDQRRDVTAAPYNVSSAGIIQPRNLQTMTDGKFRRDWITNPTVLTSLAQYFGVNWPLIRYADVLLMFAEAENELKGGPTPEAYEAINQVRRRGFGKAINTPDMTVDLEPGLDKTEFFNALVQERSWELGGEGIRKYDLIRWNLLEQKIVETRAALRAMVAKQAPYENLPATMYFAANSTTPVYLTSLYEPAPATAPANSVSISWVGTGVNTTLSDVFAIGFKPGKSELLPLPTSLLDVNPNLKQDYGY